jgi:hypothetical protein
MDDVLAAKHALHRRAGARYARSIAAPPLAKFRMPRKRGKIETLAVVGRDVAEFRLAEVRGLFEHRIEHWREIAGRGIDDLQHFGGRSLLFERLVTLGFAFGKLTSQIGYELLGIG